MIIDAILREVYANQPVSAPAAVPFEDVPENLQRFFSGKRQQVSAEELLCCRQPREHPVASHRRKHRAVARLTLQPVAASEGEEHDERGGSDLVRIS